VKSTTATSLVVDLAVAANATAGNNTLTVHSSGSPPQTATTTFFVQVPTSLSIVAGTDSTTAETGCTTSGKLAGCGVTRAFTYQVNDQAGQPIRSSMELWDSITTTSPNELNLQTYKTTCPGNTGPCGVLTFPDGTFSETLTLCAPACKPSGTCTTAGSTGADQLWSVAGKSLTSDVKHLSYQCDKILVNNQ
jgi:hypothetical protein